MAATYSFPGPVAGYTGVRGSSASLTQVFEIPALQSQRKIAIEPPQKPFLPGPKQTALMCPSARLLTFLEDTSSFMPGILSVIGLEGPKPLAIFSTRSEFVANMYASVLSVDANTMVIPKDLSNAWYAARREALATQTPIEDRFSEMRDRNFYVRNSVNADTNHIRHLFWAHLDATKYYQQNSHVINEEDFVWDLTTLRDFMHIHLVSPPEIILFDRDLACLNAIRSVIPYVPRVICRWHMNRNVLSKARQVLDQFIVDQVVPGQDKYEITWQTDSFMSTYYEALNAETEFEFENARAVLKGKSSTVPEYLAQH
ncbi:unnamed protein product [Phytophthora fragariaefolia]|uniref:Unnamed protein product n=1 Tax=Phytophthora fragariaefolia TaxID=1490495 RepID=A0A9W6U9J1_9STRA|nr:unnamed protein product [Phytophthora fragariaefolia]